MTGDGRDRPSPRAESGCLHVFLPCEHGAGPPGGWGFVTTSFRRAPPELVDLRPPTWSGGGEFRRSTLGRFARSGSAAAPTMAWSTRLGAAPSRPAAHARTVRQPRSPDTRMVKSGSSWTYFTTWATPSIHTRSNAAEERPSGLTNGSRRSATASSSRRRGPKLARQPGSLALAVLASRPAPDWPLQKNRSPGLLRSGAPRRLRGRRTRQKNLPVFRRHVRQV